MTAPLRIHWRLPQRGEGSGITRAAQGDTGETGLPDLERQIAFCREAETCGPSDDRLCFTRRTQRRGTGPCVRS